MAGSTWEALFNGDSSRIRKALFGSVFVKDYGTTDFSTYSPFDATSGELSSTLLTTDGWADVGWIDDNGVELSPTYSTADTTAWQSRQPLRTDATEDSEQIQFNALQSSPVIDALYNNLPIAGVGTLGEAGYKLKKDLVPQVVYRSLMVIGGDGALSDEEYFAVLYPRALMIKPDKQAWQAKSEVGYSLTFQGYPDPISKTARFFYRGGPAWNALATAP